MTAIYLISFDPDTRDYYIHADGQIAAFAATYVEACAKQAELTTRAAACQQAAVESEPDDGCPAPPDLTSITPEMLQIGTCPITGDDVVFVEHDGVAWQLGRASDGADLDALVASLVQAFTRPQTDSEAAWLTMAAAAASR
jgi:hypothetical protein